MTDFALPEGVRGHGDGSQPDGMLSAEEGAFLAERANDRRVLELGSWCGLSTIVLARTAHEVWAADWHCGDGEMGFHNTLPELWANLARHAPRLCPVILLVGPFVRTLATLRENQFDMVYIDAAHDDASVRRDSREALRLVRPGGLLVWHDADREEVRKAAETVLYGPLKLGPGRLGWYEM